MPIEVYEIQDGTSVPVPMGATPAPTPAADGADSGVPGAPVSPGTEQQDAGAPPATDPPSSLGEEDGDEEPQAVSLEDFNRSMARMRRRHRQSERALEAERTANREAQARMLGQIEALQRVMQGAAPTMPDTPTGPPQAEQYTDHDTYVRAAARYEAQQELQSRDQQAREAQQRTQAQEADAAFKERYAAFAKDHPDLYERVQTHLVGKVAPHVEQALALLPEGPALAYALASQPETVQRLNTLPPPQMLFALAQVAQGIPNGAAPTVPPTTTTTAAPTAPPPALPPPLTPVSGQGSVPSGTYRPDMTQAEYKAWRSRTSQLPKWRESRNGG